MDPGNDGALDASLPAVVPVPDAGLSAQELDLELAAGLVAGQRLRDRCHGSGGSVEDGDQDGIGARNRLDAVDGNACVGLEPQ